ncbi:MAG: CDP-alcohol phosphatidyltransferase family protein [Phycisphaerae bacterium]|jgi:CDP-diacylglycerol--glycerol-3-phosphate 3-phosphatidyltransferase|nr:CDP-alcohol phosphatidyltransferase family protein [Phycisphaerae bacterium]MDP7287694.1 CDP-alcohol phosphatidyltransferase family protein [Phycisphaerae bacterium]
MIGRSVGFGFSTARDAVARVLVKLGVTPNALTLAGGVFTGGAGVFYALGAGRDYAFLVWAAVMLILALACDMLDGAVARIGGKSTVFGGFLDSTLDRFSDFAVFAGIAIGYASLAPANITFVLLAMLSFFNSFMISYTKARAEDIIESCPVGYWQRGERSAAVLIATFANNLPALLIQQAILPMFTVLRRMLYTKAITEGRQVETDPRKGGLWLKLHLWYWRRMSLPYDFVTGVNIAWLIFAPIPTMDMLGDLIRQA